MACPDMEEEICLVQGRCIERRYCKLVMPDPKTQRKSVDKEEQEKEEEEELLMCHMSKAKGYVD